MKATKVGIESSLTERRRRLYGLMSARRFNDVVSRFMDTSTITTLGSALQVFNFSAIMCIKKGLEIPPVALSSGTG